MPVNDDAKAVNIIKPQPCCNVKYDPKDPIIKAKRPRHLPKVIINSSTAVNTQAVAKATITSSVMY
jgi:hypothetical protein